MHSEAIKLSKTHLWIKANTSCVSTEANTNPPLLQTILWDENNAAAAEITVKVVAIWEQWWGQDKDASPLESCTIITTDANKLASEIHNRMPVILSPNNFDLWLDPSVKDINEVAALLDQYPDVRMSVRAVSTYVNNARNEGAECLNSW